MTIYLVIPDNGVEGHDVPAAAYTDMLVAKAVMDFLNTGHKYPPYIMYQIPGDENVDKIKEGYFKFELFRSPSGETRIIRMVPVGDFFTAPVDYLEYHKSHVWAKSIEEAEAILLGETK